MTALGFCLIVLGILVEVLLVERSSVSYDTGLNSRDDKLAFLSGMLFLFGGLLMAVGFIVWLWRTMP